MSLDLLANHVDVHVGGIDLRFPHHENERAQSNAVIGAEAVDLWVHGEHLLFEGRKMSKSSGNVVLIEDVIAKGFDPLALRLCFLENRYRSQMDLTWNSIQAAHETLNRWRTKMSEWGDTQEKSPDQEIVDSLLNDLDTPRAILRLREIEKSELPNRRELFLFADQVFGLDLARGVAQKVLTPQMESLLEQRATARTEKRWAESDQLRIQLEALGLEIKDTKDGQSWS
jgi:cysteinyl-tRNA synthetase